MKLASQSLEEAPLHAIFPVASVAIRSFQICSVTTERHCISKVNWSKHAAGVADRQV